MDTIRTHITITIIIIMDMAMTTVMETMDMETMDIEEPLTGI